MDVENSCLLWVCYLFNDTLMTAQADNNVAVLITSGRAFAISDNLSSFIEARLNLKETVEEVVYVE